MIFVMVKTGVEDPLSMRQPEQPGLDRAVQDKSLSKR